MSRCCPVWCGQPSTASLWRRRSRCRRFVAASPRCWRQTTFPGSGEVELNDPDRARELIQIVREALHNAQKHSGATRVAVGLERNAGYVEISIQDNGSGFPFAGAYSLEELDLLHLGPASIKRRVRGLGGDLRVDSRPGFGSGLKIRVEG